jgi:hypothetical protein
MEPLLSPDVLVGSVDLTENNAFVVSVGGGGDTTGTIASVDEAWLYYEGGVNLLEVGWPGFYNRFEFQLGFALSTAAGSAVSVSVRAGTPQRTPFPWAGLKITTDTEFTLRVTSPAFTLDPRLFGLSPDDPDFGDVVIEAGEWHSPYSIGGVWRTPRRAVSKFGDTEYEQYDSGPEDQIRWRESTFRELLYGRVPAALVRKTRAAEDIRWARAAGLAHYDTNNNLERLWEETMALKKPFLVFHGHALAGTLEMPASGVEIARLRELEQRSKKSALWTDIQNRGEKYSVRLALEVLAGDHKHS